MPMPSRRPRLSVSSNAPPWPDWRLLALASLAPLTASAQIPSESDPVFSVGEVVIVTARKVEEDAFDVPMSLQVVGGSLIDEADLSDIFELQFAVPGLVVASAGFFGAGIALRGVTDQGGGNLAVAPHMDGVYLGRSTLALSRLFDVDRVEVLKGPQGTLYGRNATGGSISVVTRAPEDSFSAALETAVGSFDTARVRGHANVPFGRSAIRLAMVASEGDGFIRNSVDNRRFAEQDYIGSRVSFGAEPGDRTTLNVVAQRVEDDGASNELWLPAKDNLRDPSDIWLTTVTIPNPFLSMTNDFVSINLSYAMNRATLESVSGYARSNTYGVDDCAGSPALAGCIRRVDPDRHEQRSQELRLRSGTEARHEWVLGLYAVDTDETTRFYLKTLSPVPINDSLGTTSELAYAAFGQITHRFDGPFSLTGGLRWSRDKTEVASIGYGIRETPVLASHGDSWEKTSWRVGMEYALTETSLLYASVATGFKAGAVSIFRLPTGEFDGYDPEELIALEVGVNLRAPERSWTLQASAFSYDFRDLQVSTYALVNGVPRFVTDNAAAARIYGLDVAAVLALSNRLTLSGGTVWTPRREFVEYTSVVTGNTLSGNTLSRAPEWSASLSVEHRWSLRRAGEIAARLDYDYRSDFFFRPQNEPQYSQGSFGLWNLLLRLESASGSWYGFASARNLRDTPYFTQAFIQSAAGLPANYEVGLGRRF